MSISTRLAQAWEDLVAAKTARSYADADRMQARALEAEQERPQDCARYALRAVNARMEMDRWDKEISRLLVEIAELDAAHAASMEPVVLTADQCRAVDDTAGLVQ